MQNPPTSQYKTAVLIIACVGGFLAPFMASAINIALPQIGTEFSADAVTLSWVATSFLLSTAVFLIPLGRISDLYGRERMYIAGAALYLLGSAASALAWTLPVLLAFRVIQGIAGAMLAANTGAIVTETFLPGERGRAMGISVAFTYLGISLGPFAGGFMTQYMGWRSLFWANALVSLLMLGLILWQLKRGPAALRGERFDLIGSIIYAVALTAAMLGFTELPEPIGFAGLAVGVAIFLVFMWYENRVEHPALDLSIFRHNRVFAFSNVAALINYGATFAVGFLLSFYLQYAKGLSPGNAGVILVAMPLVQAALSPIAGRLSDRIEPRVLASVGMGVTAAGLLMLTFVGSDTQIWYLVMSLVVIGCGFALFSSTNINAIMSSVEAKILGVASATLGTMRMIGQVLSMGIATMLIGLFVGHVAVTPQYYSLFVTSQQVTFAIFAVMSVGGVFASLARGATGRLQQPPA